MNHNDNNRYGGYDEQKLIQEVHYLHSLWHQGPPPPSLSSSSIPIPPNPIPIPYSEPNPEPEPYIPHPIPKPYIPQPPPSFFHPAPPRHHLPFTPAHTASLPPSRRNRFRNKRKRDDAVSQSIEWPCPPSPAPSPKGWATRWAPPKPHSASASAAPSEKEQRMLKRTRYARNALRAQRKASQAIRNFLIHDSDDEDDDDDDYDYELEEIEEFIVGIFTEDVRMRRYYKRRFESGEFICLVCDAVGKKKSGKRYKDCVSLVMHAMSISRTAKKRAHRAFGQALCRVLSWDVKQLPMIVTKKFEGEGEPKEDDDDDDDSDGHGDGDVRDGKVVKRKRAHKEIGECSSKKDGGGGAKDDERSSKEDDVNNRTELLENGDGTIYEVRYEPLGSGAEGLCENPHHDSSLTTSGWPSINTVSSSQIQKKALKACEEYLVHNADSDCDDDNDDHDGDDDEDELIDSSDPEACEEFKFFLKLFTEDADLRSYYENNSEDGALRCLICGALGRKKGKKFKGCVGLIQHSYAVRWRKKKRAHRAYSRVICKIVGLDFDRLPAVVLKGETLGSSLATSTKI